MTRVSSVVADVCLKYVGTVVSGVNSVGGDKVKVAVHLSDSSYSAVQSAILFLSRQCGMERPPAIREGLALY